MNWENVITERADEKLNELFKKEIKNISSDNFKFNYRKEHTEYVLSIGMYMCRELNADYDIMKASILLHDIGRTVVKKGHGDLGAEIAGEILKKTEFPQDKLSDVKYAIASHVGFTGSYPETLEARILWDADKLSKLGAFIVLQKSMIMTLKGKNSFDAAIELKRWVKKAESIKDRMKTELGSKMAEERYKTLESFVAALNIELELNE
jgi:uncharacterized protein